MFAAFFVAPIAVPAPRAAATLPPYAGGVPVRMAVDSVPLGFDPDGNARWLVVTKFFDAGGRQTLILANSDFDWSSRDGRVQWQTRMRYGQPAAILTTPREGPLTMRVHANEPKLGTLVVRTDTRKWTQARVVAQALGPHLVAVGWFPRVAGTVRVDRVDRDGRTRRVATLVGASSAFRDASVAAGSTYRYVVDRNGRKTAANAVVTPPEPVVTTVRDASGKGMWLFYTVNPVDDIYFRNLDPAEIADRAARAGLRYVELRLTYGAYWEVTPEAKPVVDAIVDSLAKRGIAAIAWAVPRDTSFEDVAASVRAATYRTGAGTPVRGLAVDLERGSDFMGDDPGGKEALWRYLASVRAALGPDYLIVSNVEDPYFEHLDNASYPYAAVARSSTVVQPMAYWRMFRKSAATPDDAARAMRRSYDALRRLVGWRVAVSMGGQTSADGPGGAPTALEIRSSLQASRKIGAIGECFFAWNGTLPDQWEALRRYRW
ncbi:MAG: hypothetical protein JOY98_02730 [Candidatus Eremiobacteraeota bacterium]|nr:hypothetical protein [Candidatus Eremiobacteraeota bacterium]